jgi:hypothetical protein
MFVTPKMINTIESTNQHIPSLPSLADPHQRTTSSHELILVSSTMSSPRPSSIFSCKADDESAEQPSDDTATMIDSEIQSEDGNFRPETTPTDTPIPPRPSHLEHPGNKNIRHGGDLMSEEVVPMTHPVGIVLQLLGPACLLLCELHQVLRLKPSEFPKVFNAQAVCVHKECIATKQGYIDVVFGGNIVGIGDLAHKGLGDRFGDSKARLILDLISGKVGLLKIMANLHMYCRGSGLVQLPTTLRCTAAIMYQDFIRIFHCGKLFSGRLCLELLAFSCNKGPRTPLPYQI